MSRITRLEINNMLGIREFKLDTGKINIFKGAKGSGKSSILEGLEKAFTNQNRRTEIIGHGEREATLYVKLDSGLEIDRKIRNEKSDYLKITKEDERVPSTEKFLRGLLNGDVFRPIDWIDKGIVEQTKSILNMLEIGWGMDDIEGCFGEKPSGIDYDQHILQVLKAIELKYYKDREDVNRQIRELITQMSVIKKELPDDYDGEKWSVLKVQDYYNKVAEAQKVNNYIVEAKALQENIQDKLDSIQANSDSETKNIQMKYKDQRQDIKDIIELSNTKIDKLKYELDNADSKLETALKKIELDTKVAIQEAAEKIKAEAEVQKDLAKKASESEKEDSKTLVTINEKKIAAKQQELISIDSLEKQEIESIVAKTEVEIERTKERAGKAAEYLESNIEIDVKPLQNKADEVAEMQSYLRQWDMLIDIRDKQLAPKERYAAELTAKIQTARTLPGDLLKTAKMPIDGISVDEKGMIRINRTLIDGLSDGEKLELAMKMARVQAGELKVICLDRFESLNKEAQEQLLKEMQEDDFQYFITTVADGDLEVEKREVIA